MHPTHVLVVGLHAGFDVGQLPLFKHSTQVAALSLHTSFVSLHVGWHTETKPPVPTPPVSMPPVAMPPVASPPVAMPLVPTPPVATPPVAAPPMPVPPTASPPMPVAEVPPVAVPPAALPPVLAMVPLLPAALLAPTPLVVLPPVPLVILPPTPTLLVPPMLVAAAPPCPVLGEVSADEPPFGLSQLNAFVQSLACSEQPRLKTSRQQSVVLAGVFIGAMAS
jgi:hypothetical protein